MAPIRIYGLTDVSCTPIYNVLLLRVKVKWEGNGVGKKKPP